MWHPLPAAERSSNDLLWMLTRVWVISPAGVGRCKIEPTVCSRTAITVNNASLVITRHDDRRRSPLLPTPRPSHPGRHVPTLTEVTPSILDPDSRRQTIDASVGHLIPDATNKERQDAKRAGSTGCTPQTQTTRQYGQKPMITGTGHANDSFQYNVDLAIARGSPWPPSPALYRGWSVFHFLLTYALIGNSGNPDCPVSRQSWFESNAWVCTSIL